MSSSGEHTDLIPQVIQGEGDAINKIWHDFFQRLVTLARTKLRGMPRRSADEEDVALSALNSFFNGAKRGAFRRLEDSKDLWQILVMITVRKAADLVQYESREIRDWRRVASGDADAALLEDLLRREPDPAFALELADQLAKLRDERLAVVALRKLEGHTNEEIATELDVSVKTIEKRLSRIRQTWEAQS